MKTVQFISLHLFRQVLAAVATCLHGFCSGMVFGYSAVMLPQLKDEMREDYDEQYDSWIASVTPLSMALGCIIAGPIIDQFGRRISLIFLAFPFVAGWLIMGFSPNVTFILLGRAVTGICAGAYRPMALVYLGEVTDPKYRAMFSISTSLSSNIGVLLSHSVGTYLHWKTAAIVFSIPNILAAIILVFLKESPLWLITKGKSDDGSRIFYWYRDTSEAANKELNAVLNKQMNKSQDLNVKDTIKVVFSKNFLGPFAITSIIFLGAQFCGVNILNFYAPALIKKTFSDSVDNFLIMIVIDVVRVFGTATVFCIVKHVSRRLIFLLCSFLTTVCIFCLTLYLYFESSNLLWFGLISLILFIFFSVMLATTGWSLTSEVYPNSVRGIGSASTSSMSFILLFVAVKITPGFIDSYGMIAYYMFSAGVTAVCAAILYFMLPETNGKTLQEIEDSLSKVKYNDVSVTCEQTKL